MHSGKRLESYERVENRSLAVGRWTHPSLVVRRWSLAWTRTHSAWSFVPRIAPTQGRLLVQNPTLSLAHPSQTSRRWMSKVRQEVPHAEFIISRFTSLQEAMRLTAEIYQGTANFPKHEPYGLTQRSAGLQFLCQATLPKGKVTTPIRSLCVSYYMREGRFWSCRPSYWSPRS